MFYRYNLYIMKHLAWSALLVTFSLTSIIWLTQALRFIDFIVNRGVEVSDFLKMTLLMLPSLLLIILPLALFAAVLFTYSKLGSDRELTVMSGVGLSRWQLAKPALIVATAFTCFAYLVSMYLMPVTYHQFRNMQLFLRDNYASLLLQEQVFNNPIDGLTVFIRDRDKKGGLYGVLVHDNRDKEAAVTMMAEKATLVQTSRGPSFLMDKGSRQEFREGKLSVLDFDSYTLDISFYANKVENRTREPKEMFIRELFETKGPTEKAERSRISQAHQRITWPFFNITFTLVAMVLLLRGHFSRRGQPQRIVISVLVGLSLTMVNFSIINIIAKQPQFVLPLYIMTFGVALIALWLLFHEPGTKPQKTPVQRGAS